MTKKKYVKKKSKAGKIIMGLSVSVILVGLAAGAIYAIDQNQVSASEQEVKEETGVIENESSIEELEAKISALETSKKDLQTKLDEVTADKINLQTEISELKETIVANQADIGSLNGQIENLDGEITILRQQKVALEETKSNLEASNSAKESEIAELNSSIETLNSSISALEIDKVNLQTELNDKNATITDLNNQILALNEEINNLNDEISKLKENEETTIFSVAKYTPNELTVDGLSSSFELIDSNTISLNLLVDGEVVSTTSMSIDEFTSYVDSQAKITDISTEYENFWLGNTYLKKNEATNSLSYGVYIYELADGETGGDYGKNATELILGTVQL